MIKNGITDTYEPIFEQDIDAFVSVNDSGTIIFGYSFESSEGRVKRVFEGLLVNDTIEYYIQIPTEETDNTCEYCDLCYGRKGIEKIINHDIANGKTDLSDFLELAENYGRYIFSNLVKE